MDNFFVFDSDHSVSRIDGQIIFTCLLLISESGLRCAKWILLVALADLEAQGTHLVFHQLIVDVGAGTWVLPNLFGDGAEEVAADLRLERWLWLHYNAVY